MLLVLFFITGLFAQFVDGVAGMGYGAFSASILITIGIMPAIASASIHTAEIFVTFASGVSHWKFGNIKREWLLPLTIPGCVGGCLGAYFLSSMPGDIMKPPVAIFLLLMGVLIVYRFIRKQHPIANRKVSNSRIMGLGFVAAFLDAIGGGGWGPIATPSLILTGNEEPRRVVGTVNLAEFFITIIIAVTFFVTLGTEGYDWGMIGLLLIGGFIAAPIAAYLCRRLPPKIIGIVVGIALIAFNIRTLLLLL